MVLTIPRQCNALTADNRRAFGVEPNWNFAILREVDWSDVDGNHHANHLVFLRWCEDARNRHSYQALGNWPGTADYTFVLRSVSFAFERSVGLGDRAMVTARTAKFGTTSWVHHYAVWDGTLVGRGEAVCVFVDAAGAKVAISGEVRDGFRQIDPHAA